MSEERYIQEVGCRFIWCPKNKGFLFGAHSSSIGTCRLKTLSDISSMTLNLVSREVVKRKWRRTDALMMLLGREEGRRGREREVEV